MSRTGLKLRVVRPGFTLIEVMIALALGALIITGAWTLLTSVADSTERAMRRAEYGARDAQSNQLVRDLVRRVQVDPRANMRFGGTPDSAWFASTCDTPEGWQELCFVRLFPVREPGTTSIRVHTSTGLEVGLTGRAPVAGLTYLDQRSEPREWRQEWSVAGLAPSAIGVIRGRDTVILVTGQ